MPDRRSCFQIRWYSKDCGLDCYLLKQGDCKDIFWTQVKEAVETGVPRPSEVFYKTMIYEYIVNLYNPKECHHEKGEKG